MENKNQINNTPENEINAGVAALFNAFHYLFVLLGAVIVILIIWYFTFGGAFTVEQNERVLVMNFGVLEKNVYKPGWHWTWPYPVTEKVRLPGPDSLQTVTTEDFWFYMKPGQALSDETFSSKSKLVPGKDGYLLTGDANIIHGVWMINYYISDPLLYFKTCMLPPDPKGEDNIITDPETGEQLGRRGPRTLLKNTMDNTIIKLCAVHTIDYVWKSPSFHTDVENALKAAVNRLNIGVTVDRVAFVQRTTPPVSAIEAFRAVTKAQLKKETERHKAENYAIKRSNEAESESAKIEAEAHAYATEVVESIKSDTKTFKAILKEYKENPDTVPVALYSDTLSDVITSADDIFILRANSKGNQEIRLLLNRNPEKNAGELNNENSGKKDKK